MNRIRLGKRDASPANAKVNTTPEAPASAPPLKNMFSKDNIFLDVDVKRPNLFDLVATHWSEGDPLLMQAIVAALEARESKGSTGLGKGVAIPHARLAQVKSARAAIIRIQRGIDFDSVDGEPVSLFFCLLVPTQAVQDHLQLLSKIAFLLADSEIRKQLLTATMEEILAILADF